MSSHHGRNGYLQLGTVKFPAHTVSITQPLNLLVPHPVGNLAPTFVTDGLRTSAISASLIWRQKATELDGDPFWTLFTDRTWSNGRDDVAATSLVVSDSHSLWTFNAAKPSNFSITIRPNQLIGVNVTFLSHLVSNRVLSNATDYSTFDASEPRSWQHFSYGVGWKSAGEIYSIELAYSNNLIANAPLGLGGPWIKEWQASIPVVMLRLVTNPLTNDYGNPPVVEGGPVSFSIGPITFTLASVRRMNPTDTNFDLGPVYRTLDYVCLGTVSQPNPLNISVQTP